AARAPVAPTPITPTFIGRSPTRPASREVVAGELAPAAVLRGHAARPPDPEDPSDQRRHPQRHHRTPQHPHAGDATAPHPPPIPPPGQASAREYSPAPAKGVCESHARRGATRPASV